MQKLLTWPTSCLFGFFPTVSSLDVEVYGVLLLLFYDDRSDSSYFHCIITPNTHTHTHSTTNTHHSCCAVSWLATFWAYVPHGALYPCSAQSENSLSPLCLLSQRCAHLWQGQTVSILLYWMTEQHAFIQLWVKGYGLWFTTQHIKIDYSSPSDSFRFHCKSKTQIKLQSVGVFCGNEQKSIRFNFTVNKEAAFPLVPPSICNQRLSSMRFYTCTAWFLTWKPFEAVTEFDHEFCSLQNFQN